MAFKALLSKLTLAAEQVAYVGDDLIDAPVMGQVGLSAAVTDARPLLQPRADYLTSIAGGRGAARAVCDLLLVQGKLEDTKGQSV
ncbi:MAG: 3-deoxy-D-manno-octulosonate 8-phosphate phosphatase KdsC [Sodalis sp.]|nr:MAG: 3-deoxy-D-manno-octulosonate 8-phosphate phosphatase KdsC [Sodalis sp.]